MANQSLIELKQHNLKLGLNLANSTYSEALYSC